MTAWAPLLDALEERTARYDAALDAGRELPDLPDVALPVDEPLPAELRLRAAALLEATQRVERRAAARKAELHRASAYAGA